MAKKRARRKDGLVYSTDPDFLSEPEAEESEQVLPGEQEIKITLDNRHRGGKTVTLMTGFDLSDERLSDLSKQLKDHCGTGGSFKDQSILLQGDHRDKALRWMRKKGFTKTVRKG